MDEPPIKDDPEAEEPQTPAEVEEAPQPKTQAPTEEVVFEGLATGKEPWRGGGGCSSRLPLYGCLFGMALLIGILFIGTSMMRRTVWVNLEKARRAVVQSLPRDLPAAERQRTINNLERLRAVLESSEDPYPEMGEFVNRVRAVLKDGRFTADEVGGLNVFIERMIEESGIPPLQLGAVIRNEELGTRRRQRYVAEAGDRRPSATRWRRCVTAPVRAPVIRNVVLPPGSRQMICRRVLQGPPQSRCRVFSDLGSLNDPLAGRKRSAYKNLGRLGEWAASQIPNSEFV